MPEVIHEIADMADFKRLLQENPGLLIIKFGAEWCVPCKKIKDVVDARFQAMPETVQCVSVDVDESFEVYAYLMKKKMVAGVPAMLMYRRGNETFVCDDSVTGANLTEIDAFFGRCLAEAAEAK